MSQDSWNRAKAFAGCIGCRAEDARWFFGDNPIAKAKFDTDRTNVDPETRRSYNKWARINRPNKHNIATPIIPNNGFDTVFLTTMNIMAQLKPLCEQTSIDYVRDCLDKLEKLQVTPEEPRMIVRAG